jgi:hypothetical protein
MPEISIRCIKCGDKISIDSNACPYEGDIACFSCKHVMEIYVAGVNESKATRVHSKYPFDPEKDIGWDWNHLTLLERSLLNEAAKDIGTGAFTSAEFMALRVLESVCRRFYIKKVKKELPFGWGKVLDELADTEPFRPYVGIIGYFKEVRNRLAHPDDMSDETASKSSYMMVVRLIKEMPLKDLVEVKRK